MINLRKDIKKTQTAVTAGHKNKFFTAVKDRKPVYISEIKN